MPENHEQKYTRRRGDGWMFQLRQRASSFFLSFFVLFRSWIYDAHPHSWQLSSLLSLPTQMLIIPETHSQTCPEMFHQLFGHPTHWATPVRAIVVNIAKGVSIYLFFRTSFLFINFSIVFIFSDFCSYFYYFLLQLTSGFIIFFIVSLV